MAIGSDSLVKKPGMTVLFLFENIVDRGKMNDCSTSLFSCTVGSQATTKKEGTI